MKILDLFPRSLKEKLEQEFHNYPISINEIRVRVSKPIILKIGQEEKIIMYKPTNDEVLDILNKVCENSIYTYQSQLCEGFITIEGGHRVGVSGNVVIKDGKIININHICSLNFRIAKQVKGCSDEILKQIISNNKCIENSLIVSAPGAGKTTILRDLARNISDGNPNLNIKGMDVSIIDERGEIAAMYKGIPQNDVGIRTDVINNVSKPIGIKMAIRSLAPKIVIADEIGNRNDSEAINYAVCSGVSGIFSAHGNSVEDLKNNPELNQLLKLNIFKNIIFLDKSQKGKVREIWKV